MSSRGHPGRLQWPPDTCPHFAPKEEGTADQRWPCLRGSEGAGGGKHLSEVKAQGQATAFPLGTTVRRRSAESPRWRDLLPGLGGRPWGHQVPGSKEAGRKKAPPWPLTSPGMVKRELPEGSGPKLRLCQSMAV